MAFSGLYEQADWATQEFFAPKVQDVIFNSNAVTAILRRNAKTVSGGNPYEGHSLYKKGTQGGWISREGTYTHAFEQKFDAARWTPKVLTEPVALFVTDLLDNKGNEQRRFDLTMNENMAAAKTLADNFADALFSLDYTNTNAIDSLDHAVSDQTGTSDETGFSATYASVPRGTTDGAGWRANVDDSSATLSLGVLNDLDLDCSEGGMAGPTLYASNNKAASLYYDELTPIQRQGTDEMLGKAGFTAYMFNGKPWVIDSHIASSDRSVGGVSTEYVYALDTRVIELRAHEDAFFAFMGIKQPIDQWAVVGRYFFYGNVMVLNPRYCGKLSAITG